MGREKTDKRGPDEGAGEEGETSSTSPVLQGLTRPLRRGQRPHGTCTHSLSHLPGQPGCEPRPPSRSKAVAFLGTPHDRVGGVGVGRPRPCMSPTPRAVTGPLFPGSWKFLPSSPSLP